MARVYNQGVVNKQAKEKAEGKKPAE